MDNFTEKTFWVFCLTLNNSGQITFSLLLFSKVVWHHCYKFFGLCKHYFFNHWHFIMPASSFRITIHLSLCFWYPYFGACAAVACECWYKETMLSSKCHCSGGAFPDLPLPCFKTLSKSLYLCFPVPFSSYFSAIFALGKIFVS